jgi:hypothetical protein
MIPPVHRVTIKVPLVQHVQSSQFEVCWIKHDFFSRGLGATGVRVFTAADLLLLERFLRTHSQDENISWMEKRPQHQEQNSS